MKIHTLGPAATDSNEAAYHYMTTQLTVPTEIQLHPSFESILTHLKDWPGDSIVMPTAFQSSVWQESWGDIHYQYLDQLVLIDSFITPLAPLVVVENLARKTGTGYTHAATARLLKRIVDPAAIKTCDSKVGAYQCFLNDGQYVLTNEKNVTLSAADRVIKRMDAKMVWCVYQIKTEEK